MFISVPNGSLVKRVCLFVCLFLNLFPTWSVPVSCTVGFLVGENMRQIREESFGNLDAWHNPPSPPSPQPFRSGMRPELLNEM